MPVGLAITGPTASGKTALSLEVARRLDGEIVSVDSRQVYRGMDIGTAKATAAERAAVPHQGLDLIEPSQRYSAGRFARDAQRWIAAIRERGRTPVLVGGTGFFLRALTQPLFREPPMESGRRRRLEQALEPLDEARLWRWLARLDPPIVSRMGGAGGRQRLKRAIEVALLTGRPLSWWQREAAGEEALPLLVFVCELPRAELYRRIDRRVHAMVEQGLLDEVRRLRDQGFDESVPGMSATGYREMLAHLRGDVSLDEAIEQIQRATRQYARRQLTWFRNQLPESAVRLDATRPVNELADEVADRWRREEGK